MSQCFDLLSVGENEPGLVTGSQAPFSHSRTVFTDTKWKKTHFLLSSLPGKQFWLINKLVKGQKYLKGQKHIQSNTLSYLYRGSNGLSWEYSCKKDVKAKQKDGAEGCLVREECSGPVLSHWTGPVLIGLACLKLNLWIPWWSSGKESAC